MPSVKPGTLTGRTTIISRDVATVGIEEAYAKIVTATWALTGRTKTANLGDAIYLVHSAG